MFDQPLDLIVHRPSQHRKSQRIAISQISAHRNIANLGLLQTQTLLPNAICD